MKTYKQLPVEVKAVHYGGDNPDAVEKLLDVKCTLSIQTKTLFCNLPEGEMAVPAGFWVCIGSDDRVYCLSDTEFNRIYYRSWERYEEPMAESRGAN